MKMNENKMINIVPPAKPLKPSIILIALENPEIAKHANKIPIIWNWKISSTNKTSIEFILYPVPITNVKDDKNINNSLVDGLIFWKMSSKKPTKKDIIIGIEKKK